MHIVYHMVASSIIFLITISHTAVANKALPSRERGVFQPPPPKPYAGCAAMLKFHFPRSL